MSADDWSMFGPEHYQQPARGRQRNAPIDFRRASIFDVARRDGWTCAYCGVGVLTADTCSGVPGGPMATLDHVVPRCRGGADTNRNCVIACMPCNSRKRQQHPRVMFGAAT